MNEELQAKIKDALDDHGANAIVFVTTKEEAESIRSMAELWGRLFAKDADDYGEESKMAALDGVARLWIDVRGVGRMGSLLVSVIKWFTVVLIAIIAVRNGAIEWVSSIMNGSVK